MKPANTHEALLAGKELSKQAHMTAHYYRKVLPSLQKTVDMHAPPFHRAERSEYGDTDTLSWCVVVTHQAKGTVCMEVSTFFHTLYFFMTLS